MAKKTSAAVKTTALAVNPTQTHVLPKADFYIDSVDGKNVVVMSDKFKSTMVHAAVELDKYMVNVKPLALNLYVAWKQADEKGVGWLPFCHAFDATVPLAYGKAGTDERKKVDSHPVVNRFKHLIYKIGRMEAGDGPVAPSKADRDKALKSKVDRLSRVCLKYKIQPPALEALFRAMGYVSKDDATTLLPTAKVLLKKMGKGFAALVK